jgi:transcription elongation factor GreA
MLEGRIRELQRILEVAQVVDHLPNEDGMVTVGSVVTVEDLEHREKWTFRIVDTASAAVFGADEEYEHVSAASPLGQALVGKKVGDIVQVETPGGIVDYEILSVHT